MAFAVSTVIGAVGVGIAGVSAYNQYTNSKASAAAQAAGAAKQAEIGAIQAANVDVQRQQLDLQYNQQRLQTETQRSIIQDQATADGIRMQAAQLDATRRQREAVRAGIVARAQSINNAANRGGGETGSTATAQANASIAGQTNTNIVGIGQQLDFAERLYDINKDITAQYLSASYKNDQFVAESRELQDVTLSRQKTIYQLGGEANTNFSTAAMAQGNAALWGGIGSLGTTLMNNSSTLGRLSNYFSGSTSGTTFNNNSTSQIGDLNYFG